MSRKSHRGAIVEQEAAHFLKQGMQYLNVEAAQSLEAQMSAVVDCLRSVSKRPASQLIAGNNFEVMPTDISPQPQPGCSSGLFTPLYQSGYPEQPEAVQDPQFQQLASYRFADRASGWLHLLLRIHQGSGAAEVSGYLFKTGVAYFGMVLPGPAIAWGDVSVSANVVVRGLTQFVLRSDGVRGESDSAAAILTLRLFALSGERRTSNTASYWRIIGPTDPLDFFFSAVRVRGEADLAVSFAAVPSGDLVILVSAELLIAIAASSAIVGQASFATPAGLFALNGIVVKNVRFTSCPPPRLRVS